MFITTYVFVLNLDIDECIRYQPCQNNGTCINNDGSFICHCTEGWQDQNCDEGNITFKTNYNH